jgi:hypothetical protein
VNRLSRECGILTVSQPYTPRPFTGTALLYFGIRITCLGIQQMDWGISHKCHQGIKSRPTLGHAVGKSNPISPAEYEARERGDEIRMNNEVKNREFGRRVPIYYVFRDSHFTLRTQEVGSPAVLCNNTNLRGEADMEMHDVNKSYEVSPDAVCLYRNTEAFGPTSNSTVLNLSQRKCLNGALNLRG